MLSAFVLKQFLNFYEFQSDIHFKNASNFPDMFSDF